MRLAGQQGQHGGHMDSGGGEERVHAGSDVAIDAEGDDGDER